MFMRVFQVKITTYGSNKLPCSTGIFDSSWVILVEGRADILNLLRAGYDNALAIEGARIDESIKDFCATKDKVVAFFKTVIGREDLFSKS